MVNKYFLPPGRVGAKFSPPWEGGETTFLLPGRGGESTFPTLGRWGINLT